MPLFYQHNINESTRLGIWHIEEDEAFFLKRVPLKRDVSHPLKRLQHLAGRYLLTELFPDFPLDEILIADTRKPYLADEQYHFSISHCGTFAAAIVSTRHRVGIDVEQAVPVLNGSGKNSCLPENLPLLTTMWTVPVTAFVSSPCSGRPRNPFLNGTAWGE